MFQLLEEKKNFEVALLKELKLQKQLFDDSLREQLIAKDKEKKRAIKRALSEQAEQASLEYKHHLAALIGRLKGLEKAIAGKLESL